MTVVFYVYNQIITRVGSDRYWVMFASVLLVCVFTKLLERSGGGDEEDKVNGGYQSRKKFLEEAYSKKDVVTEGGQLIHFTARTDLEVDHMLE